MTPFIDRFDAGRKLSHKLKRFTNLHPIVVAIPRGGVEIGYEVARTLGFPLRVFVSRKIGAPHNREFGVGAVAESYTYIDQETVQKFDISHDELSLFVQKEKEEVRRRVKLYRGGKELDIVKRTIIIVDDGLATGVTAIAAVLSLKKLRPAKIIFASPMMSPHAISQLKAIADEIIFLVDIPAFGSVSSYYQNFNQVSDKTVLKLLSSLSPN